MVLFYWTTAFLSHLIPRRVAIFITERIADVMYFTFYRKQRDVVISNLKMVYKKISPVESKELALRIYRNFAIFIYEFLVLPKLSRANLFEYLSIKHKERLDNAIKEGTGVLVLTAHLGNWELGAAMLGVLGYSPTVIALSQQSRYVKNFFTQRRESVGMKVVYLGRGLKEIISILNQKGEVRPQVAATLGDHRYSGPGIQADFFGKPISFPYGVFELASRTGALILPAFCVKEGSKYMVYFEPPIKEVRPQDGVKEWSKILERYVRKYITQWFIFDPLWV